MESLANRLGSLSTQRIPSSITLDQLPEDIIQVIINFLTVESPGKRHNAPLSWVEKDAQDNVFQRSPWNDDLNNLAMVSRRMREEIFLKNRLRVVRVKDTAEDLARTDEVISKSNRHYVRAIIIGNGRITEGVEKCPDYVEFCAGFPALRAIRHASPWDYYAADHVPNPPFRFHSLDSLDVYLPSALLEEIPADIVVEPVSVDSLTLRSYEEFMLHLPGPFTDCKPDWLHNVVRQVKDVRHLNLHMGLEDDMDRDSPYYSRLPQYDPFPGFWAKDFPNLREVNVYFVTRYRRDVDNPCDIQSFRYFFTHFTATIRHIRFFVQYPDAGDIIEYIRELPPTILPHDRSLLASINRYFPTLEQLDAFLETIATALPQLESFEVKFDDERAHPPPLIHYAASIQRDEAGKTVVPVITAHTRKIDGEAMAWLVDSAAELMGISLHPPGLWGWEDEFDDETFERELFEGVPDGDGPDEADEWDF